MLNYTAMYHGDTELKRLYRGGTLIWEKQSPAPVYDETKIAIVLLDDEDNFTNDVHYETTIQGAKTYMLGNPENRYFVHIGDNSGIEFLPTLSTSSDMPNTFYSVPNMIYLYIGSCVTGFGSTSESLPGYTYRYGALQNCTGLKKVEYSGAINYSYSGTFANCTSLEDFTIPPGVSEIPSGMFNGCTTLHTLNVSDGVTTFRNGCCSGTLALSTISLPSSITTIESYAFSGSGLTQITIDKPSGSISGAPWGATNATVTWTG